MKQKHYLGLSEEGFHRIAYTEWGEPNHTSPIICAHGLTRNGRDFDWLAAYLSENNRHVYCPDMVGRGESDWLKNPIHYSFEQYLADTNVLIALTKANRIDWIGTSMGGIIGMILASLPNSPIQKLVLNDIGPQIPVKALARLSRYAGQHPTFKNMDEATLYFKTIHAEVGEIDGHIWQQLTANSVKQLETGEWISKLDPAIYLANAKSKMAWQTVLHPLRALEGILFDIDLWHIFRKITCPILLIHGERSDILTSNIIKKMQRIRDDLTVLSVPETGHAPLLVNKNQQSLIYEWLRNNQ